MVGIWKGFAWRHVGVQSLPSIDRTCCINNHPRGEPLMFGASSRDLGNAHPQQHSTHHNYWLEENQTTQPLGGYEGVTPGFRVSLTVHSSTIVCPMRRSAQLRWLLAVHFGPWCHSSISDCGGRDITRWAYQYMPQLCLWLESKGVESKLICTSSWFAFWYFDHPREVRVH